jgi:predicted choloylglycine hydrolase
MMLEFNYMDEQVPDSKWLGWFDHYWPVYRAWFLSEGEAQRPTYREVIRALDEYMPEIAGNIDHMAELAGGGDHTARFLGQYCPPPFFAACSQAILTTDEPVLVRNYDYSPRMFDALIMKSRWNQTSVIGTADCMTGLVDGMNEAGLAISLAFGGRRDVGPGFGIGLTQRYILETCETTIQAVETLKRIPVQISYNIALLDQSGNHATVMLSPNAEPTVTGNRISTNHQDGERWDQYTDLIESDQRFNFLEETINKPLIDSSLLINAFLSPPLFRKSFEIGYGTLYTVAYFPLRKEVHFFWPEDSRICSFNEVGEWSKRARYSEQEMDATPLWPDVHHSIASLRDGFIH